MRGENDFSWDAGCLGDSVPGSEEVHELVRARLRRAEQRYTDGKRTLVDLLLSSGRPMSITDIAEGLPELPRSSAYRHLVDLQNAQIVHRVTGHDEFGRFELAEDLTEHHHHLLCTDCGKVVDITPSNSFERTVTRYLDELATQEGFAPQSHRVDVLGVCSDCRAS